MSTRVLIIPEDPTLDQHILKPVVERIFVDLQRKARVEVLRDPHLTGISQALSGEVVKEVVEDNQMMDLFLLIVDRDCENYGNTAKAEARRKEHAKVLIATLAQEEVEVWPLALHRTDLGPSWATIRKECHPKERYFDSLIKEKDWLGTVGKGRKRAMRSMGKNWQGLLELCPEIKDLKMAIKEWLATEHHL